MASLPQPPDDLETKKIIDKLAQFVARNGPEFEQMTKQKQKDNPQFAFLFGGVHYNYYQYRVTTEQVIQKQQAQKATNSEYVQGKMQQLKTLEQELQKKTLSVAEQIKQSEANLIAHEKAIDQMQQTDIEAAISQRRAEKVSAAAEECAIDLSELDAVLTPLRNSCTKDNIQNAKSWVLINITDSATCEFFSMFLIERVFTTDVTFDARLHLAYLINDIMHHCARKNTDSLRRCMENVVIPIFCISSCQASEEQKPKLQKLLTIWSQHKYFIPEILEALENPSESYEKYQADLMTKYSDVVAAVTKAGVDKMQGLQAQHQEFTNHLNDQLRRLQQQYEQEKSAVMMSGNAPMSSHQKAPTVGPGQMPANIPPPGYGPQQPISAQQQQPPPLQQQQPPPPQLGQMMPQQQPPHDMSLPPHNMPGHLPPGQAPAPPGGMFDPNQPPPMFNQPPPGFAPNIPPPMIGLSGPPPRMNQPPPRFPPPNLSSEDLIPTAPYFDLPAGLMCPLVKLSEVEYKPIKPGEIRLPPPAPPTEKLLMAVESFYQPPSHDCPVDAEGWEKLGLFEYYQSKNAEKKRQQEEKEKQMKEEKRFKETKRSRSRSREKEKERDRDRRRSRSRERDRESRRRRSRSDSRSPPRRRRSSRSPRRSRRSRSRSPAHRRRSLSRSVSRSPTPPRRSCIDRRSPTPDEMPVLGMFAAPTPDTPIGLENKGAQILKKWGWSGAGLGASEQGIVDPVKAAEVRGASDMYKGIGMETNDPFENFRKNRSGVFIQKLKDRDEMLQKIKKANESDSKKS